MNPVLRTCGDPYPVSHPYPRAALILATSPKVVNAPLVTPQAHDILAERMIEIVQRAGAAVMQSWDFDLGLEPRRHQSGVNSS
jgi:hypothetical protein